jgi:hypothetical protein
MICYFAHTLLGDLLHVDLAELGLFQINHQAA